MDIIRLFIIDDHPVVRKGLIGMFDDQQDIEVVGEADGGAHIETQITALTPDVVLLDVSMPGLDGVQTARRIGAAAPAVRILAFTMRREDSQLLQMLQAGATGYLLKSASPDTLLDAVRHVAAGRTYIDPSMTDALTARLIRSNANGASSEDPSPDTLLSPRERDVLRHAVRGWTNKEIANHFHISVKTVETHKANLKAKLRLHTLAEMMEYAGRHGLL